MPAPRIGAIPTGELKVVAGTPFDFRKGKVIGKDIEAKDEQIKFGKGFDHNFVVEGKAGKLRPVARLVGAKSGRVMEISSTEPGVQLYTGNFMEEMKNIKGGGTYNFRGALCLETQHFPDSPNQPEFPSTVLKPGDTYETTTVHKFSAE